MKKMVWLMAGILALMTAFSYNLACEPQEDERSWGEGFMDEGQFPGIGQEMEPQGIESGHGFKPGMGREQRVQRERFRGKIFREEGFNQQDVERLSGIEEEVILTIKKHDPKLLDKILPLRTVAPAKYKLMIRTAGKMFSFAKLEKDESLEKDAVRAFSLEYDIRELASNYEKASDKEKESIKKELQTKVSGLFDLKLKGQEIRIKKMEKELTKLRKKLEGRKANKSKIVKDRVEELTGEGYRW